MTSEDKRKCEVCIVILTKTKLQNRFLIKLLIRELYLANHKSNDCHGHYSTSLADSNFLCLADSNFLCMGIFISLDVFDSALQRGINQFYFC